MELFIASAMAQTAQPEAPSLIASLLPLILIVVIFWFLLIRPQMKRNKEHKALVEGLSVGDEVITAGGLLGRISSVADSFVTVEVNTGVEVHIQRHSIAQVVPKGTMKNLK